MVSILVIDDDAQLRAFVRLVSEGEGHEVRDGWDGIRAHRRRPADLILCDIFMPEKEGLETIRQLITEFPGLKVVAMSGGIGLIEGRQFLLLATKFGRQTCLRSRSTA